jgi:protoporphyrin/coproporphyrin ferrochelatase
MHPTKTSPHPAPEPTLSYTYEPQPRPAANFGKKRAIVLVNLGTPDGTDYRSMRRYLKEFLSDPRVIEVPRIVWWLILNLIILTFRPFKSGKAYASIWDKTHNSSPLRVITAAQTKAVQAAIGPQAHVAFAMRYGQPGIQATLKRLQAEGYGRFIIAPLYPQYSAATTGTVLDEVARYLLKTRWQPSITTLPPYYDHPAYITALAISVKAHLKTLKKAPEVLITSFHGLPLKYCQKGDVYYCHSHKTARLLAEKLGYTFCRNVAEVKAAPAGKPKLLLTFQSRFGNQLWLQPYTDDTLEQLAHAGLKNVAVMCPGFAADCVETLEEIALEGREEFMAAGGQTYSVVPCLNASPAGIAMLLELLTFRE